MTFDIFVTFDIVLVADVDDAVVVVVVAGVALKHDGKLFCLVYCVAVVFILL